MNTTQDKLKGNLNVAAGKIKGAVSDLTGDEKMKTEGETQTTKGEAQKAAAALKEAIHLGIHATGDAIELAGKTLRDSGAKTLGNVIKKAGDKIEHSLD